MSDNRDHITCIQLSKETKSKLDDLGKKQDTYEDIIKRLLGTSQWSLLLLFQYVVYAIIEFLNIPKIWSINALKRWEVFYRNNFFASENSPTTRGKNLLRRFNMLCFSIQNKDFVSSFLLNSFENFERRCIV